MAVLSFVPDPAHDPLGEWLQQRLRRSEQDCVVRETLRPDLGRLKGLLLAALTDPRFEGIVVVADLAGSGNESLVSQVASNLQQPLAAWPPLVTQLLWPTAGAQALWFHHCLGRSHRRLLAAFTGSSQIVEPVVENLLLPQLDNLLLWSGR